MLLHTPRRLARYCQLRRDLPSPTGSTERPRGRRSANERGLEYSEARCCLTPLDPGVAEAAEAITTFRSARSFRRGQRRTAARPRARPRHRHMWACRSYGAGQCRQGIPYLLGGARVPRTVSTIWQSSYETLRCLIRGRPYRSPPGRSARMGSPRQDGVVNARLRLADLLAGLSVTSSLGFGLPPEHAMHACLIGTALAREMGLDEGGGRRRLLRDATAARRLHRARPRVRGDVG